LLLAWPDRSFEKAQVYLLSIELFQSSDRAKMMARWDASCGSYFVHVPNPEQLKRLIETVEKLAAIGTMDGLQSMLYFARPQFEVFLFLGHFLNVIFSRILASLSASPKVI
jgi:hypothetical protein